MSLSKKSTLEEIFAEIEMDEPGVQVLPVTVSKPKDPVAHLMIIIQGQPNMAHSILAQLMAQIAEMHESAEKAHAHVEPENEPPKDLKLEVIPEDNITGEEPGVKLVQ